MSFRVENTSETPIRNRDHLAVAAIATSLFIAGAYVAHQVELHYHNKSSPTKVDKVIRVVAEGAIYASSLALAAWSGYKMEANLHQTHGQEFDPFASIKEFADNLRGKPNWHPASPHPPTDQRGSSPPTYPQETAEPNPNPQSPEVIPPSPLPPEPRAALTVESFQPLTVVRPELIPTNSLETKIETPAPPTTLQAELPREPSLSVVIDSRESLEHALNTFRNHSRHEGTLRIEKSYTGQAIEQLFLNDLLTRYQPGKVASDLNYDQTLERHTLSLTLSDPAKNGKPPRGERYSFNIGNEEDDRHVPTGKLRLINCSVSGLAGPGKALIIQAAIGGTKFHDHLATRLFAKLGIVDESETTLEAAFSKDSGDLTMFVHKK